MLSDSKNRARADSRNRQDFIGEENAGFVRINDTQRSKRTSDVSDRSQKIVLRNSVRRASPKRWETERHRSKMALCKSRAWRQFRALLPFVILIIYSALGGLMFQFIETSGGAAYRDHTTVVLYRAKNHSASSILKLFHRPNKTNDTKTDFDEIQKILQTFAETLCVQPSEYYEWNYWSSVFYAGSLYTSIGYGNHPPNTVPGKVMTMIYALIGIPLLLHTLNALGKFMCACIWKLYTLFMIYVVHRCCRCVKCCQKEQMDLSEFPFSVAIFMTFGWMFLCAVIFCQWEEEWDYFTSFYFFFQSLTTIGLGDSMPKHPRYLVFSFILVIMGLAMVSMCWNLVQIKLDAFMKNTMKRIRHTLIAAEDAVSEDTDINVDTSDQDQADRAIQEIAGGANAWLYGLLGDTRKQQLISQWEHQSRHRNKRIQTENPKESQAIQASVKTKDQACETDIGFQEGEQRGVPYREVRHRLPLRSSDEFSNLLKELGYILNDCQDIVRQE